MTTKRIAAFLIGALLTWGTPHAQPSAPLPPSRKEVAHLLDYVEQSKCQFNRNGTWHEARDARLHLQKKYDYLDRKGLVPDAESFIERAASKSSMSGQAYQVRCADGKAVPSARWLTHELSRLRNARAQRGAQ
jgi:hypothetical protein